MEYFVFVIYVIAVIQFINSKPIVKASGIQRGHDFYKVSGIFNIILGNLGMLFVNYFLRDKDIIPQIFVWIALGGFALIMFYGAYCICRMMFSVN